MAGSVKRNERSADSPLESKIVSMQIREPFNALSHFFGALAVLGGVLMLVVSQAPTGIALVSLLCYGTMACLMFCSSSLYHWTREVSTKLQKLDHSAIYLMIAGTYTPVCLLAIRGNLGIGLLVAQWTLATIGVIVTIRYTKPPTWIRLVLYLLMGWMVLPFVAMLLKTMPMAAVWWMIAGGLSYTFGTIIYASKRPKLWEGVFSFHELWHVFVLAGAGCHFMMVSLIPLI